MKQLRIVVEGLVQGVGFRYYVQDRAESLGLSGYAANLSDGRVEVVAQGPEEQLKLLAESVRTGPVGASIAAVEEKWSEAEHVRKGFEVHG